MTIIRRPDRTDVQTAALVVAIAFVVAGCLGFIPGITTNYDTLNFTGHYSRAELLGIFKVSSLHNLVHLGFGVVGIAASRSAAGSRRYLLGGGLIYLVMWVHGLMVDKESGANFLPLNSADDWMHFATGVGMIALGLIYGRRAIVESVAHLLPVQKRLNHHR
ncbi:DUF4383 domain-containing protein [Williamsia sp.]|uniref:DUF4383 domain-containing protein n=1 Tax=Williamsia sp. TaxID=1872085 RepID=UPI002F931D9A